MRRPVWFLAHPVADDVHYTFPQNMAHVLTLAHMCFAARVPVIAPYLLTCQVLDDLDPLQRKLGMDVNDELIFALGRVILCGHRRSKGMQHELELATSMRNYRVIDLVGVPDAEFYDRLKVHT